MVFGRGKQRKQELERFLTSDEPSHRLLAALHAGTPVVIDGDAAAMRGRPDGSINDQRQALLAQCRSMARWLSIEGGVIRVLFDRSMDDSVQRSKSVVVELFDDRPTAAGRVIEMVDDGDRVIAVWGDDANAVSLQSAGVTVVPVDVLFAAFADVGAE